jgi:hypothetical protein
MFTRPKLTDPDQIDRATTTSSTQPVNSFPRARHLNPAVRTLELVARFQVAAVPESQLASVAD